MVLEEAGCKQSWHFWCFACCLLLLVCDVLSCSCERGRGVGGGGGWGGGRNLHCYESLHAHEHTCQCTQLAKSVWRATNVHPSKHEFARRVCVTRARNRPACFILNVWTEAGNHCKTISQPRFTLMCFAACIACLEASASIEIVGCSLMES